MTTGFQQQHQAYCAIVRAVAKPQHVGAQLTVKDPAVGTAPRETASFKPALPKR